MSNPVIDARKADAPGAVRPDEFTYVLLEPRGPAPEERRSAPRRRTRLRSGKIVGDDGRFVTECLVYDVSASGSRLRHPAGVVLPTRLRFYDDQTGTIQQATVLWRNAQETGVRFTTSAMTARDRAVAEEMRRKFYAVLS